MNYDKLDNEELLRLALDAINGNRDAEAVVMLKILLEREPGHVFGQYLLAAQHAQLGMFNRAEAGFRAAVKGAPDLAVARFQLGQLLVMKGEMAEAAAIMAPLVAQPDALGAYARAMTAATVDDTPGALAELEAGLALPQEIPALAADMQRLHAQLQQTLVLAGATIPLASGSPPAAPIFLTGYGREG